MNRTLAANSGALALALAGTLAVAWPNAAPPVHRAVAPPSPAAMAPPRIALADGTWAVADAWGHPVPLRPYARIVSTNLLTDRLLVELCEPTRILAVSRAARERKRDGFRYQGMGLVDGFGPVEGIVALKPDLVLTNSFGSPGSAERMRSAGIEVFNLGELHGEASLSYVALSLGELLGAPERAQHLLHDFSRRMRKVAAHRAPDQAKRALFLSILGPDLQGGTAGTSYHDILVAAGLVDIAASRYRGWPAYSAEAVLAMAPEIVVTRENHTARICAYPGMDLLPPCRGQGRIVELPGDLLDEPGLAMLEAAEELFARVYESP